MKKGWVSLFAGLLLLLSGCGGHGLEGGDYPVYFLDQAEEGVQVLRAENRTLEGEADVVEELLQAILLGPESEGLIRIIPASVSLRDWSLANGLLTVDLSGSYGMLSGIDLTLADYSIVLTLTQLEQVEAVMITVEGQLLPYRDHQRLIPEDVRSSILQEEILENAE